MDTTQTSAAAFNDRLISFTPNIARIARATAGTLSEYDHEDIQQTIYLKLLERAASDPTFAARSDSELLTFAQWRGRHKASAGRTYTKYVEPEDFYQDDHGDEISNLEMIAAEGDDPEEACIRHEAIGDLEQIMAQLDPINRQIVWMLYRGYSQNEIAAALKLTKGAISQRKQKIASYLAGRGA